MITKNKCQCYEEANESLLKRNTNSDKMQINELLKTNIQQKLWKTNI